jgi:hypothetical protein
VDEEVRELVEEQAGDELFGLAPEEFVAARDDLARRLKREGDAEAAARVKALRRPPLSAWAVNQLARGRGPELERLLAAGERLRSAHQAALAGGGAAELRAAARAEREAATGLVEAALERLREAGHPATDTTRDRIAATLHAAAADPDAADLVRHGRLTSDLDPSGFGTSAEDDGASDGEGAVVSGRAPRRRGAGTGPGRAGGRAPAAGRGAARGRRSAAAEQDGDGAGASEDDVAAAQARRSAEADDQAAARARRLAAVAARDEARKRARLAADQAVLATRQAERLGRLADQAEREAARTRATAGAAIEAAIAARERAAKAARELRDAEDHIPADR